MACCFALSYDKMIYLRRLFVLVSMSGMWLSISKQSPYWDGGEGGGKGVAVADYRA